PEPHDAWMLSASWETDSALPKPFAQFDQRYWFRCSLHILNALNESRALELQQDVTSESSVKSLFVISHFKQLPAKLCEVRSFVDDSVSLHTKLGVVGKFAPVIFTRFSVFIEVGDSNRVLKRPP